LSITIQLSNDAGVPAKRATPTTRQVNFRLPYEVWARLDTAAGVLGLPQSRIVSDALQVYFDAMPKDKRRVIDDALVIRQKP
jgi:hypothetical protein